MQYHNFFLKERATSDKKNMRTGKTAQSTQQKRPLEDSNKNVSAPKRIAPSEKQPV